MGLYYEFTKWLDHVVQYPGRKKVTENPDGTVDFERAEGEVVQRGTAQSATNFNNLEKGVFANQVQLLQTEQRMLQAERRLSDLNGAVGQVTLTNNRAYPFNNSSATVPIAKVRSSLNYDVQMEVISSSGGFVEEVIIYDKQVNGFKIKYTGSAKSVVIKHKVSGGIYK
ncbi:hypothetical protein LMF32_00805 [Desemzia sp. C1]|uniref:hypothetical protein n=1 Tax=Desemzia sp. C1 TaxID=2892016 RepID=UPI001E5D3498|nr:hypothetical protein [Desemzia sp. C1]MCI3027675.1 hypothetical protein [Desemzia sp. C1]